MLITLSRRAAICQSVAEVLLTGVVPLGAVSHRFNLFNKKTVRLIKACLDDTRSKVRIGNYLSSNFPLRTV